MPVFTSPGVDNFEMRTSEPADSIAALFRQDPHTYSGDATSARRYSEYQGVEVTGSFTGFDSYGWPLQGTITSIRLYVLGTPGDPSSGQLLYEVTGGAWDVEEFRLVAQVDHFLLAFLNSGDDQLYGGSGTDNLVGGAGDDTYHFNSSFDWAHESAGGGYDTIVASASYALRSNVERLILTGVGGHTGVGNTLDNEIVGNDDGNRLVGAQGDDALEGGAGNDILFGGEGDDLMTGGEGDDTFYVEDSGDQVFEQWGDGFDRVFASADFTLGSGQEVEQLRVRGSAGISLGGNELDNVLIGGAGDDVLNGGGGVDEVIFSVASSGVTVDLVAGTAGGAGTDQLIGIENVRGTSYADAIRGDGGANHLRGYHGDDALYGRAGEDVIRGGDGADLIDGGADSDQMYGGLGTDNIRGGSGDDLMLGGDGDDILHGGQDSDRIFGGPGMDTASFVSEAEGIFVDLASGVAFNSWGWDQLYSIERVVGTVFEDWLSGSDGSDRLSGGDGADVIGGGRGNDTLTGGVGGDEFYFNGEDGFDVVTDFTAGAGTEDVLAFEPGWFDDFADVLAHATDTAGGLVIAKDGLSVRLARVTLAQFHEDDVIFCGCTFSAFAGGTTGKPGEEAPLVLPRAEEDGPTAWSAPLAAALLPLWAERSGFVSRWTGGPDARSDFMARDPKAEARGALAAALDTFDGRDPHGLRWNLSHRDDTIGDDADELDPLVLPAGVGPKDSLDAPVVCNPSDAAPAGPFAFVMDTEGLLSGRDPHRLLLQPTANDWVW